MRRIAKKFERKILKIEVSMKSKLLTFFMALSVFCVGTFITTQKSHALIGHYLKSRSLRTFGNIAAGTGTLTYGTAITISGTYGAPSVVVASQMFIPLVIAPIVVGLGLVLLDDQTVTSIDFLPITQNQFDQYSLEEIEIYNSELEELNAIKDSIEQEIENKDDQFARNLWKSYSHNLHPATIKIAQEQALRLVKKVKTITVNK